jgi:hypothetical protein
VKRGSGRIISCIVRNCIIVCKQFRCFDGANTIADPVGSGVQSRHVVACTVNNFNHVIRHPGQASYPSPPDYKYLSIYLWIESPLLGLGRFFRFFIVYTVGMTPWTGDQPVARPLPARRTEQTQNKRTQTSVSQVGFEPTIPAFERAKTVHAHVHWDRPNAGIEQILWFLL